MTAPLIYGDFNGGVDTDTYRLDCVGTNSDVERLGITLVAGMSVTLYDYDGFESGEPAWILADAVVAQLPDWGLVARVDPQSFRWVPRNDSETSPSNAVLNLSAGCGRPSSG